MIGLVRMLEDFNMEVVLRQNFYDFFAEHRYNSEDSELLYRMEAFDKKTVRAQDEINNVSVLFLLFSLGEGVGAHYWGWFLRGQCPLNR